MTPGRIAVVHLVWKGAGLGAFDRFIASYRRHRDQTDHTLIIVFKGFSNPVPPEYHALLDGLPCEKRDIHSNGKDIAVYHQLLDDLYQDFDSVLFFNSNAELHADAWLTHYVNAFTQNKGAIIGATGSYERLSPTDPFPNIHLRTNAFFANISLLQSLDWGNVDQGGLFEAGPNSLFKQLCKKGLPCLIVDRWGGVHKPEDWAKSGTFRHNKQHALLVSDNRTRAYQDASIDVKLWLHLKAWAPIDPGHCPKMNSLSPRNLFYRFFKRRKLLQKYAERL